MSKKKKTEERLKGALQTIKEQSERLLSLQDELLKKEAVAAYFEISLPTLDAWRKKGIIKAMQVGRVIRFSRAEVVATFSRLKEEGGLFNA